MLPTASMAGLVAALLPVLVLAGPDNSSPADADGLEEIVVVGQKQEMNLQKAPESITAITADTLKAANIVTPLDLNGQVPGLVITTSEGFNRSVSIRGIGFNVPQNDSAQPSVSYHEDGIYIANPVALNSGFLDVDHVEVLRGPQGTVFGQNSIGGTVNVISNKPTFDAVKGFAEISTGSFDLVHTTAAVNLPVTGNFAVRVAFDQFYQHGDVVATQVAGANGSYDLNNQNSFHARISALWSPTDALSILLRAEYAQAHQHEAEGKNIMDPESNPWRESSDWPGRFIYNQQLAAATIAYDFSAVTLKLLSSYQEVNQHGSVNEDGEDLALYSPVHDVEFFLHNTKNITEEVDLSNKPGGAFDWIVGAFYLKSRLTVGYNQYDASFDNPYTPDLLQVNVPSADTVNAIYSGQLYYEDKGVENRDSWSGYGQTTFHATDSLRLTAGLRYTRDHNTTGFSNYYDLFGPPAFVQQTATKLTYRVALEYDVTPTNLAYVSVSTGFKPSGGNIALAPAVVPIQFQPETITAYEIGSKNSLLDKRLNVNLSAYVYQDKNMQYEAEDLINFQGGVDNIPHVQVYGLDAEVAAILPYGLRFSGNAAWEKGRITSHYLALDNVSGNAANQQFINQNGFDAFENVVFTGSPALNALRQAAYRDVYGNAPPSLPEWMASLSLSHTLALAEGASLLSSISVQYRSDYADTIFGKTAIYTAPSFTLTNLFFDYTFAGKALDVSLNVNNLFNQAAVLSRFTNQYGGETTQQYYPPREFVVRAGYRF